MQHSEFSEVKLKFVSNRPKTGGNALQTHRVSLKNPNIVIYPKSKAKQQILSARQIKNSNRRSIVISDAENEQ